MINHVIGSKYKIVEQIGSGSFGDVYKGKIIGKDEYVAIKIESSTVKKPQLSKEAKIYKLVKDGVGFADIKYFGIEGEYSALVMPLLGISVEELFNKCGRSLDLKTVLIFADQALQRIQYLHNKKFIHQDIKPENFVIGLGNKSNIFYLIDFGLAKRYFCDKTNAHIPFREGRSLTGTARYASLNTHIGIEQSRRDDIESLCYVLIYLLKGGLPWQGVETPNKKERYERIAEKKFAIPIEMLCEGIPTEFSTLLDTARKLDFETKPDYFLYRKMFRDLLIKYEYVYDGRFTWTLLKYQPIYISPASSESSSDMVDDDRIMLSGSRRLGSMTIPRKVNKGNLFLLSSERILKGPTKKSLSSVKFRVMMPTFGY